MPVRQFGADRLDPIKVVYVGNGVEASNKTNPVEAEAIVDQIRKCLADPQYDRATIGVISLTGKDHPPRTHAAKVRTRDQLVELPDLEKESS